MASWAPRGASRMWAGKPKGWRRGGGSSIVCAPMRIHVLSDLHQEFGEFDVPSVECDCVVLAGDVSTKQQGLKWIVRRFPEVPVIYICGNHEFYGDKLPQLTERLRAATRGTNVHFLETNRLKLAASNFSPARSGPTWPCTATGCWAAEMPMPR